MLREIRLEGVSRIEPAEAKDLFDRGLAQFLDVRDAEQYALGHIPGAFSRPLGELARHWQDLPIDQRIVLY